MKSILTIVFSLSLSLFHGQDMKQYISYTVPINLSASEDYKGDINDIITEFSPEYLDYMAMSRFENMKRRDFVYTMLAKVEAGEIQVYEYDLYSGNYSNPEELFNKPIHKDSLREFMGETVTYPIFNEFGNLVYDDNGNQIFRDTIIGYDIDDVLAIEFHEEWTIDEKTNILSKKVLGYLPCVGVRNVYTNEFIGLRRLFYIPCEEFKTKNKSLIKNYESQTQIIHYSSNPECGYEHLDVLEEMWWADELLPDKRNPFVGTNEYAPFLSSDKELKIYETFNVTKYPKADFPYDKEITLEKAVENSSIYITAHKLDPETGAFMYDENGYEIFETYVEPYETRDIVFLGFVEEWFFDEETLSIQKEVKGVSPVVYYVDPNTGEIMGTKSLYCIRYE